MSAETKTSQANAEPAPARPVPITMHPGALEALKRSEKEIAAYRRELPRLIEEGHGGRYALIMGDQLISIWDTQGDAIQAGCDKFGLEFFYVKKIDPRDEKRFALLDAWLEAQCQS